MSPTLVSFEFASKPVFASKSTEQVAHEWTMASKVLAFRSQTKGVTEKEIEEVSNVLPSRPCIR